MPEEREVAEALEHAVAAVEAEPSGHALTEHARSVRSDKLKSTAAVLTALAALIAATGAFLKTFDHGVTESAYNTLSESIVKLSDQEQKTQQDVASIRGYLDGLSRAPMAPSPGFSPMAVPSMSFSLADAGVSSFQARPLATSAMSMKILSLEPSPPEVHAPSAPVKPPSFNVAVEK